MSNDDQRTDLIKVERSKLLETLQANRQKHRDEAQEALDTWKTQAIEALVNAADKAQDTGEIEQDPLRSLPKPTNYVSQYDDAIKRMEFDTREELWLTEQQFAAWVLDNWSWRNAFTASTSLYNNANIQ